MNFELENGVLKKYSEDWDERGKDIVLPEGIHSISEKAFYRASIKTIVLPEGLVSIGESAFERCENLQSVSFPKSIERIGKSAFSSCRKLEEIHVVDIMCWLNVTFEDEWFGPFSSGKDWKLFANGRLVEELVIPSGIVHIRDYAFADCDSIKSVIIPEGVVELGKSAFSSCDNLVEVTLPESLHIIKMHALSSFYLRKINIKSIEAWLQIDFTDEEHNYPFDISYASSSDKETSICINGKPVECLCFPQGTEEIRELQFQGIGCIKEVIIPEGVTSIGQKAFAGCRNLHSITIPNSVTRIDRAAFHSCLSLKLIKLPERITKISDALFDGCKTLEFIELPPNVEEIGLRAFGSCEKLKTINLPACVQRIAERAFSSSGIERIEIPEGIESIEKETFNLCHSLKWIKIPKTLKKIGYNAFQYCRDIEEVHIHDLSSWINIEFGGYESNPLGGGFGRFGRGGGNLYVDGEKVTSFTLPPTVSDIGDNWFPGCAGFIELIVPDGIKSIGEFAFARCPNLEKVIIPSSVKYINDYAFSYCPKLKSVTISNGAIDIGQSTFYESTSLEEVALPSSISQIGQQLFSGCVGLKRIEIPKGVITICKSSFSRSGLTNLIIPENVETIAEGAFSECEQLQEVHIPATVSSIATNAFAQCSALSKVIIQCNFNAVSKDTFFKCSAVKEVYIVEDQFEVARDYFLKKVRFYTIDGIKLGKPDKKAVNNQPKKDVMSKVVKTAINGTKGGKIMETIVIYPDGIDVQPVEDVILYAKGKPKGFVKPVVKEATVMLDGKEFNVVFKIASKLSSIWKKYYAEKDNDGIYDPKTALKSAQQTSGFIDDSSGSYVSCPLCGQIPESTESLKPDEIETRLKAFAVAANQCVEEKTLLKIANALPKKKNGMLYKGRLVHIKYLDLVDYDGSTFEIVAKNEDDAQFCVEIRNNIPVVSDLFYQSYLL